MCFSKIPPLNRCVFWESFAGERLTQIENAKVLRQWNCQQLVLSAIRYSPNIQIFYIQYSHIQYWVADSERRKTFLKYSFIEREWSDDYCSEWPDLYAQSPSPNLEVQTSGFGLESLCILSKAKSIYFHSAFKSCLVWYKTWTAASKSKLGLDLKVN